MKTGKYNVKKKFFFFGCILAVEILSFRAWLGSGFLGNSLCRDSNVGLEKLYQ